MPDYERANRMLKEFDEAHGEYVVDGGWVYYADGAVREENPIGVYHQPPTDPWECNKRVLMFWRLKLGRALERFSHRKAEIEMGANASLRNHFVGPPPLSPGQATAELRRMKAEVSRCKAKADEAAKAVEDSKPDHLKRRERQSEENAKANQELLGAIHGIEV